MQFVLTQFISVQCLLIYLHGYEMTLLCFHMRKKSIKPISFPFFFRLTLHLLLWCPKQAHLLNVKSHILSFP